MITISPSTTQQVVVGRNLCFTGSAIVSLSSQPLVAPTIVSGANYTYDASAISYGIFTKTGGTDGTFGDCEVVADDTAYGLQPFYIKASNTTFTTPGAPNNDVHWYIAAVDDADKRYVCQVMKYCNENVSTCGAASNPGQTWVLSIWTSDYGNVYTRSVNFNETFYVQSDGTTLSFRHVQAGTTITDYSIALPNTTTWRFKVGAAFINNQINFLQIWKGTYQGSIPLTWSAPDGGTLDTTGSTACFSSVTPGTYHVCGDSDFDDPVCVEIDVAALNLTLADGTACDCIEVLDEDHCSSCFFTGDVIKFASNGGLDGTLTVTDDDNNPIGTVINSLTWQAPGNPVHANIQYTLGEDVAECNLSILDRIRIYNIEGDVLAGMVPGETLQIQSNYSYPFLVWENVSCPNIVTPDGVITIPSRLNDSCFGDLDCYIQGKLVGVPGETCPNITSPNENITILIRIIVDPVYPTPEFGGPRPIKWKPETPDFRVIVNTMEGGCDETYIRNRVPTYRWTIRYDGLSKDVNNPCDPIPCCDDTIGFPNGYDESYQSSNRLDDFWNLVYGEAGYFTLKDYRTGEIWRKVRFESKMGRDHINWYTAHSRDITMIWSPCCAGSPEGGTCSHFTILKDTYPPTVPTGLTAIPISSSRLRIFWEASVDNVGVKGYILLVDGREIRIEAETGYLHKGLVPEIPHTYRVRAFDFAGNYSEWSAEIIGVIDFSAPGIPPNFRTSTITTNSILLEWDAAIDPADTIPPSVPADFTATPESSSTILLAWSASVDPDPDYGDTTPPSSPSSLRIISEEPTVLTIGWDASTD
jgi:hypothetical protein